MRWVLPGGAALGGNNREGDERPVACRPRAAVLERTRPPASNSTATAELVPDPPPKDPPRRLATVKQFLEVLAVFVGLIGAVLALLGLSRK